MRSTSFAFPAMLVLVTACGGGRDVIPETHDVRGVAGDPGHKDTGGYEYIAKRPLGAVGLAEARGMDPTTTAKVIDKLADSLEACAEDLSSKGRLVDGAARIAAQVSPDGTPIGLALKVAPGAAVTANALLCFITPFKLTSFPAVTPDAPQRGLAVEATWGPQVSHLSDVPRAVGQDRPDGG